MLLRHGETPWSESGQHTSHTEVDLTDAGRRQARAAADVLTGLRLDRPMVFSSPRRRAQLTAELAGLAVEVTSELLREWDYGSYEGLTTAQIRDTDPGWLVWTHGCPGGESVAAVSERADAAVALAMTELGGRDVVFVGHGHFSRAVITRWLQQPLATGARFGMAAGSVAVCGFEHSVRHLHALGLTGR